MENLQYIGEIIDIKIDRPFGSKQPKYGFIYPINYGFQEQYFEHIIIR